MRQGNLTEEGSPMSLPSPPSGGAVRRPNEGRRVKRKVPSRKEACDEVPTL
jgi:hypothetical protein